MNDHQATPAGPRPGERWAESEHRAAIREYFGLLEAELTGEHAEKAAAWRRVMGAAPARSRGAVEYRFQNISHVLASHGYRWVPGYPPASNTGSELPPLVLDELHERPLLEARLKSARQKEAPGQGDAAEPAQSSLLSHPSATLPINPHARQLLGWHAHGQGGVSVPFRGRGRPIGRTIETTLFRNLREAAKAIKAGDPGPRWIFLIGGPGNGKSQMVEEFGRFLDSTLPDPGMVEALRKAFALEPVPRRIDIEVPVSGMDRWPFRHLTIVQDASSSDRADGNAASQLVEDVEGLLASSDRTGHVFVCSANRGLLARAVRVAGPSSPAHNLLREVFRWTGLGEEAFGEDARPTWPLAVDDLEDGTVAAWPLDIESLLVGEGSGFEQLLDEACRPAHWESGACQACPSQARCPFFTNAVALRDPNSRNSLIKVLRRAELASGQRINFRMAFSMVAELIVGDSSDFVGSGDGSPCAWVHERVALTTEGTMRAVIATSELLSHEYVFGLLPLPLLDAAITASEEATTAGAGAASEVFSGLERAEKARQSRTATPVRDLLARVIAPVIDPAIWSPPDPDAALRMVEDALAQGVGAGMAAWPSDSPPSVLEKDLLGHLARAEADAAARFAVTGRHVAERVQVAAKIAAATVAKRSIGIRTGVTNQHELLAGYESVIRSQPQLQVLRATLKDLIGDRRFVADALAGFGSVESAGSTATIRAERMALGQILAAPPPSSERAAHDLPAVLIEIKPPPDARYRPIPLTFALYGALQSSAAGAVNASLPASVRASLDALGQAYASHAARDTRALRIWDNEFAVTSVRGDDIVRLVLPAETGEVLIAELPENG